VITVYAITNFLNASLLILIPLLGLATLADRGLGFTASQVGVVLLIFAALATLFQLTAYRYLTKIIALPLLIQWGAGLMALASMIFPMAGYASGDSVWLVICIALLPMSAGFMFCASLLVTMTSNLAPAGAQGAVQGVARGIASFSRGLGPLCTGLLFALCSNAATAFPMGAFLVVSAGYISCCGLMRGVA